MQQDASVIKHGQTHSVLDK